ncbi:hypothetical protein FB468_2901 [Leucobacter komagatae]|uniref:Bacterial Ig domain-containing protein n=2 Tax=Leucobacter komagatae TaxID=55969 RepID=A0A542Y9R0_9MICO|nr:hypothetical protein FB468_2901 [Leucobacter komagatae]
MFAKPIKLRAAGVGLTALMLLTGAGMSPASATVVEDSTPPAPVAETAEAAAAPAAAPIQGRLKGPFVIYQENGKYHMGIYPKSPGLNIVGQKGTSAFAEMVAAKDYTFPALGTSGEVRSESGLCLADVSTLSLRLESCNGSTTQRWNVDPYGLLTSYKNRGLIAHGSSGEVTPKAYYTSSKSRLVLELMGPETPPFDAKIDNTNNVQRSAVISGHGTPGATVTAGGQSATINKDGEWTLTVSGLALGENRVLVEHRENGAVTDSATLVIDFSVVAIDASVAFPADVSQRAVLSGTAHPGGEVTVWQGGSMIASAVADRTTGAFSTELPAPNAAGGQVYTLKQTVENQQAPGEVDVHADFGSAVSIETPVNNLIHNGGDLRFQGRGVAGGRVLLSEDGRPGVLEVATVGSNGIWSMTLPNVPNKNIRYSVEQTGRGANVTTAKVEINPGVTSEKLEVTTPAQGATLQPGTVIFKGTANAGANIELRSNLTGAVLGTAVAASDGTWTAQVNRPLGAGAYNILVHNGALQVARSFTVEAPAPVETLTVKSPAQGEVLLPGIVTFTGTANPGATIELRSNVSGGLLGSGTATAQGNWAVDVNRQLGAGDYVLVVKNGQVKVERAFTVRAAHVDAPLVVTAPAQNATVAPGKVTFAGTAEPGATVEIKSNITGALLGTGTANQAGSWVIDLNRQLGADNYSLRVVTGNQRVDRQFTVAAPPAEARLSVATPAEGSRVNPGVVIFTGTSNPGAKIELRSNVTGALLGETTASAAGSWSAAMTRPLAAGNYVVFVKNGAVQVDRAFTVAEPQVDKPLIVASPAQNATVNPGPVTFTGTANPGILVELRSNVNGLVLGSGTADASGYWTATTNQQLGVASYVIVVKAGNQEVQRAFQVR